MFTKTTIISLALTASAVSAAAIARQEPITTDMFIPRVVSSDSRFDNNVLGMYHPNVWENPHEGIADMWASDVVYDQDFVYLQGPDPDSLALYWNRTKAQSLYFGSDENAALVVNNSATGDAAVQIVGLSVGEDDIIRVRDGAFSFTACFEQPGSDVRTEVSYILKDSDKLADNCTPIQLKMSKEESQGSPF